MVCRYWVVTRFVTRRVSAHSCVREMCVRRLHAAWGVTVYGIILPFARGRRVGVRFGFVRAALLPAGGTCVVLSFGVMPGWCCFLHVTLWWEHPCQINNDTTVDCGMDQDRMDQDRAS